MSLLGRIPSLFCDDGKVLHSMVALFWPFIISGTFILCEKASPFSDQTPIATFLLCAPWICRGHTCKYGFRSCGTVLLYSLSNSFHPSPPPLTQQTQPWTLDYRNIITSDDSYHVWLTVFCILKLRLLFCTLYIVYNVLLLYSIYCSFFKFMHSTYCW